MVRSPNGFVDKRSTVGTSSHDRRAQLPRGWLNFDRFQAKRGPPTGFVPKQKLN